MTKVMIIPEPHWWDKSFEGRIRYPQEIEVYLDTVRAKSQEFIDEGHDVKVIFMGDIFHHGYVDAITLLRHINYFSTWSQELSGELYSLVGNHELTYNQMNPYWMLADLQSKYFDRMKSIPEFGASTPSIKVVDELQLGNDLIVFGHYHRVEFDYEWDKYNNVYFLTHNSLLDTEVNNAIVNTYHLDVKAEYIDAQGVRAAGMIPATSKLQGVFVGHMHCAFGKYHVVENIQGQAMDFVLQYLQSLGRTNHTEINDANLTRTLPILNLVGDNLEVEYWEMELQGRAHVIKESRVLANQEKYQQRKGLERFRSGSVSATNPVDDLRNWVNQVAPEDAPLFEALLNSSPIGELQDLLMEANNVR